MLVVPIPLFDTAEVGLTVSADHLMRNLFPNARLQDIAKNTKTKWRVGEGADGKGVVAHAVLDFDPHTMRTWVLGVMEEAFVKPHRHLRGWEVVSTLGGKGRNNGPSDEPAELVRGVTVVNAEGSIHAPGTDKIWVYVFENFGFENVIP